MTTRPDGRQAHELRPVQFIRNYTKTAPGSVLACFGDTKVLVTATIEERVPRHIHHLGLETHGWMTAEYAMLPGATQVRTQRERMKVGGRTNEIQRLIGRSLRAAFLLEKLGSRTITIDADVIQADAGTRVAAISGGYVAAMDALLHLQRNGLLPEGDLPVVSPVAAISVGIVNGEVILDPSYEEDSNADVDANIIMNAAGQFIEVQSTSEKAPFDKTAFDQMLLLAEDGIRQVLDAQKAALSEAVAV